MHSTNNGGGGGGGGARRRFGRLEPFGRRSDDEDEKAPNRNAGASALPGSCRRPLGWIQRQPPALRRSLALVAAVAAVLSFGTIYSDVTARDPCRVMEAMRRTGPASMSIPRLFHYQSKDPALSAETKSWFDVLGVSSAIQTHPDVEADEQQWTAVYWSDESCLRLVQSEFPYFAPTYRAFPHAIQRVDSCRYLILSKYGGVYADADLSLHAANAAELESLVPDGVGLVESPYRYNEVWQNSLMTASVPRHPFWEVVVAVMMERGGSGGILATTGPKMIGDAVARHRGNAARSHVEGARARLGNGDGEQNDETDGRAEANDGVHTLPCELFQRLPSGQWDTTLLNVLGREVLARAVPMRGCGRYGDGRCEVTRHVGKATWTVDSGRLV